MKKVIIFFVFVAITIASFASSAAKAADPVFASSEVVVGAKFTRDTVVVFQVKKPVPSSLNGPVMVVYSQKTETGVTVLNSLKGWYDYQAQEIRIGNTELKKVGLTPATAATTLRPTQIEALPQKKRAS